MVLAYPFLALLHVIYSLVVASLSLFRHLTRPTPSALNAKRRRIPKHLALVFVADNEFDEQTNEHCIRESIRKAIIWCQQIGITQLSVYDTHGIVLTSIEDIPAFEAQDNNFELDRGRIVYPPTPPLSDYSGSRPLSPQELGHKSFSTLHIPTRASRKSHSLTLHFLTREASKPSIAATTRSIARIERQTSKNGTKAAFTLSVANLESYLEGKSGLLPPDFMIIHPVHPSKYHRTPIELHGYPPWQIRLTEIYCNRFRKQYEGRLMWFLPSHISSSLLSSSLTEWEFREALDQFAFAEMRLGK